MSDYAKKLEGKDDLWIAGGASLTLIESLGSFLGVSLPPSYKDFLKDVGGVAVGDNTISGITSEVLDEGGGSILFDTRSFVNDYGLPDNLLVIQPNMDAPYCLDSSIINSDGEMAVVCYELHNHHANVIASNFSDWFDKYYVGL